MPTIFRSAQASRDIIEIWRYIARDNPVAADRMVQRLQRRVLVLSEHPYAGSTCDDLLPGLRALTEGRYRIFYRVTTDRVEILRILHTARHLPSLFQGS